MTYQPQDITTRSSDGVLMKLDSLRARLAGEKEPTVQAFLTLQIGDVVAEMKRRVDARISAIASAALS